MENENSFSDPMKDSTHIDLFESTQFLDSFADKHAQEGLKLDRVGVNNIQDNTLDRLVASNELFQIEDVENINDKRIPSDSSQSKVCQEGCSCDQCKKNTVTKDDLKLHMESYHEKDEIPKEKLKIQQSKTIKRKSEIDDNLPIQKISKKQNNFSCDECDYKTQGKKSLKNHMKNLHKLN